MTDDQLKAAFAAFLLEDPTKPLAAAVKLFPAEQDRGRACQISFQWPNDPFVIVEMERLKKETVGNSSRVPSKEEVIETLWELARSDKVPSKDRATSARIVAEMLNYIPKGDSDETSKRRMPTAPVYRVVGE